MSHATHQDGPALRALAASFGRPAFVSAELETEDKARDRIWELAETLHCSIVGTCLTIADGRTLLAKLGVPDARTMSEHHLHGQIVPIAGRRDGGGKLLQKMLDRRHEREIRRFDAARTNAEVQALWRESLERGEIPGAYWAALTHPATDWALIQDIFGEVHMLSHLVGQSNRADIRRLRQLEASLAERDEAIAAQEQRIRELMEQRDGLSARNRSIAAEQAIAVAASQTSREPCETTRSLEQRLAREQAHVEALEQRVATLMQAAGRLSSELEAEIAKRRSLEAELSALETAFETPGDEAEEPSLPATRLEGRTLLYVGGRPRQVANLRRFTRQHSGELLSHDGGVEDNLGLLAGLVGRSDLVLFPVECVSHEATGMVKRFCDAGGKTYRPVRSASFASFVQAVMPANAGG
ncbi:DUF2325 domain-containing protein [Methylobacterium sp. C25]|uniref:DUF2325 domain-containing protein n=1 Tax=Methylobacterium sp. C25 TaxID=2721622 RepID=UPI001F20CCAC|nr:DUF2325 domain-containing protein [Methylobacterium sp. C25]MCE4226377.1 DUF2325 domain-containing protein [Methylobacterium sp. C25]